LPTNYTGTKNLESPCLLVFDNANPDSDEAKQRLKAMHRRLLGLTNCHVLITTRATEIQDAVMQTVKPFEETEAIALFGHHYKAYTDTDLPLLKKVLTAIGRNTLVIELLAKNLNICNKYDTTYDLAELIKDLSGKGLFGIKDKKVEINYHGFQVEKPTTIIAAMYDLSKLNDTERHVLSNFAVLPAEMIAVKTFKDLYHPP